MSLKSQLKKIGEFFKPDNLANTDLPYSPAEGDIQLATDLALLVIDVQKEFCDPKGYRGNDETREVSERIKSLVPEFRKAGVPAYVVYFSNKAKKASKIDFYKFKPEKRDVLINKNADSAFQGSNIDDVLKNHRRKTLLACGFNLNACVFRTVMDARDNGYDVCVIRDLTGNDNNNSQSAENSYIERMKEKGIRFVNADEAMREIVLPNTPENTPKATPDAPKRAAGGATP